MSTGSWVKAGSRALLVLTLLVSRAHALEPAGGAPYPDDSEEAQADRAPDASVDDTAEADSRPRESLTQRTWLLRGNGEAREPAETRSSASGFSLGALVIVLGLGAAAVVLHFKRKRKLIPIPASEARLTVLSSSRIGPKAFAVSAHVGGRVLLLGVTDHNVTHLAWLDGVEREVDSIDEEPEITIEDGGDEADLPLDYPGSALRAPPARSAPLASSDDLRRFQEVLRGVQSRPTPSRRPEPGLPGSSAAVTLAAQTSDVVLSSRPAPARASVAPSLRRKRQRRHESLPAPAKPSVRAADPSKAKPRAPEVADATFEGQVAGLRRLRNG